MIPSPGVYPNVPAEEYHSWEAMSKSRLKNWTRAMSAVAGSPEIEPTREMELGTYLHAAVLEPEEFRRRARVGPNCDRTQKEWKEFAAVQDDGSWLLKPNESEKIHAARDRILAHEHASKLLVGEGFNELSLAWVDEKSGVLCKCRVDRLAPAGGVELKTTANAHWSRFQWVAWDLGYYLGAELYDRAIRKLFNWPKPPPFYVIAVDWAVGPIVYRLSSPWASEEADCALARVAACQRSGVWPGYPSGVFDLPEMKKRFVGDSSEGGLE